MDNYDLINYLSDDEKKKIAERIYEEELRKKFQEDFEKRDPMIFHNTSIVYERVLDLYIRNMNLVHSEFIKPFEESLKFEIQRIASSDFGDTENPNHLYNCIRWNLERISKEVIDENTDELKPIIREKVFKCCNETLLIAFLSDIVRQMNLDKAVKKLINESEGDKT